MTKAILVLWVQVHIPGILRELQREEAEPKAASQTYHLGQEQGQYGLIKMGC